MGGTVQVDGELIDAVVVPMTTEPLTFVTLEYHGRTFRFSIRGREAPFDVAYQHEFPTPREDRVEDPAAWFPVAAVPTDGKVPIQQYLRPQLVALHRLTRA
jgi:hypothetical protein